MVTAWFFVIAGIGVIGGIFMLVFHKQLAPLLLRYGKSSSMARSSRAFGWRMYQVNNSGHVPILFVIGAGWIVVGLVFVLVALGVVR